MTWPPRLPWWVAPLAVAVAVLLVVWSLNRGRTASRELVREREERALELAGLNVAHQADRDALLQDLMAEATASAKLAEELARIQAAAPGAKPVAVAHGSTTWTVVGPAAGAAPPSPPVAGAAPPPVPAVCPACRLLPTDEVQVRAGGAAMETDAGNYVVGAVASVWRRPGGGGQEEKLHEEKLRLEVKVEEQGRMPGWGAGLVLVGGRGGWWAGPVLAPPPLRLLGLEVSALLGGGAGPGGEWGGLAGGFLRW